MAYNYTSINTIMEEILSNPLLSDTTFKQVSVYLIDFYRIVGVPSFFIEKDVELKIEECRTILPFDFYEVNQIVNGSGIPISESTASFNFQENLKPEGTNYFIQNNYIYFNTESGIAYLSYQAIPFEDDFPVVIENSVFKRAFVDFITTKKYRILFDMGKISAQVYHNSKTEYSFSVGACETEFLRLNIPRMENFKKIVRGSSNRNYYKNRFNNLRK